MIVACLLLVSLVACESADRQADAEPGGQPADPAAGSQPASPDSGDQQALIDSGWRQVDTPGTPRSFGWLYRDGVVVETEAEGARRAVRIDWSGSVEPIPSPPGDIIGLLPGDAGTVLVSSADDGTLLYDWHIDGIDYLVEGFSLPPPAPQLEPLEVWWGTEDEGAVEVVAYRQPNGTVGIHPMDWETGGFDPEPLLFVDPNRLDDVRVGAREGDIVVVGPVGPDPDRLPARDLVWAIPTLPDIAADGQRLPRAWRVVGLNPRPDVVTDIDNWEGDVVVAGRLDNRPLVWLVDSRRIDLDEFELRADGAVLIADPLWLGEDPAIGLETPEGPVMLLPGDGDWNRVELPHGRLTDVVAIRDVRPFQEQNESPREPGHGRLFAIIDGEVWLGPY